MELLVVGAGAMGRWLAETVSGGRHDDDGDGDGGDDVVVAFADVDAAAASDAAAAVGGRTVPVDGDSPGGAAVDGDAGRFDAVCLAVPMPAVAEAAAAHAPRAREAVVDVTGAMEPAVAALREHAPGRERVSLHPLFAPANAPGSIAVVRDAPGPVTDALLADLEAAGNRTFETTAADHDEAMETVQAAAHAATLSFALAAGDVRAEYHTPVSERLVEVARMVAGDGSEPAVYREIQAAFDGADRVATAARRLADAEGTAFDDLYREAAVRAARLAPDGDASAGGDGGDDAGTRAGDEGAGS
jgi:prephenate dehydrogenase